MTAVQNTRRRKRRALWWKIPASILLVLVALLVVAWMNLDKIALWAANRALPKILGTEASVESIALELREGAVAVQGLRIAQPTGFGRTSLLEVDHLTVQLDVDTLTSQPIVIRHIEAEGFRLHLLRDNNGLNIMELGSKEREADSTPAAEAEAKTEKQFPGLRIEKISIRSGDSTNKESVLVYEGAKHNPEEPIVLRLSNLHGELDNLHVLPRNDPEPATAVVNATVEQAEYPAAQAGVCMELSPIQASVPDLNLRGVLTGLLLAPFDSYISARDRKLIGGDGLDLDIDLALSAQGMDLEMQIVTDRGIEYPLSVKGPWGSLETSLGPFASLVGGRVIGGTVGLVKDSRDAVRTTVKGVAGGAKDIAGHAGGAVGALAHGVVDSAGSILQADGKGLVDAVSDGLGNTADKVTGAFTDTRQDLRQTATEAKDQLARNTINPLWFDSIVPRHEEALESAQADLAKMPFPPPPPNPPAGNED